jgi:hypothetical protein
MDVDWRTGLHNLSTVHELDLPTLGWTTALATSADPAGAAPSPRRGFGAAVAEGRLIMFGGVDAQGACV